MNWIIVVITPRWGPRDDSAHGLGLWASLASPLANSACHILFLGWLVLSHGHGQRMDKEQCFMSPCPPLLSRGECPGMIFIGRIPAPGCCHPLSGCLWPPPMPSRMNEQTSLNLFCPSQVSLSSPISFLIHASIQSPNIYGTFTLGQMLF